MMSSTMRATICNPLSASRDLSSCHHQENFCYGTEKRHCSSRKIKDGRL